MGAACCIAARDGTTRRGPRNEISQRNLRNSPSWSFRWDNRGRVAGEETSIGWLSDSIGRNYAPERKSSTGVSAHASDGGSSMETLVNGSWNRSPMNETISIVNGSWNKSPMNETIGKSISTKLSVEVKESAGSPQISYNASVKLSASAHSTPSVSMSPLSPSVNHLSPPSSNPSSWVCRSPPGHGPLQGRAESQSSGRNSPSPSMSSFSEKRHVPHSLPPGSNESAVGSVGRSSDGWSLLAFSELISNSHREMCSFGSESCNGPPRDKMARSSGRNSRSLSFDLQTCGVCSKLLTEKSAWSSQKIITGNELSVVAVLMCGHVYHADCLECITPEINKYDPACPVCTFGEKVALQLSGKLLKAAEKGSRARSYKKSKKQVVDTDDSIEYDYWNDDGREVEGPKMASSSSLKGSDSGKLFSRRRFSFGSKGAKSTSEAPAVRRKGLFWSKSSKE
ncbi:hypothetical protein Dimus_025540 [Dionaea muscipula]